MSIIAVRRALYWLSLSNGLMFSIVLGYLLGYISPKGSDLVQLILLFISTIILLIDLIFTVRFFAIAWDFSKDRYPNYLVLFLYILISGSARLLMVSQVFDIAFSDSNLPAIILGISSIAFSFLLWSLLNSDITRVHNNLYQLLVVSNLSGIGVVFYTVTIQVFLGVKALLPLVSAFVYFITASDLYVADENQSRNDDSQK